MEKTTSHRAQCIRISANIFFPVHRQAHEAIEKSALSILLNEIKFKKFRMSHLHERKAYAKRLV